jgi:thermostable 8-oxoguanine DNA glycosylase
VGEIRKTLKKYGVRWPSKKAAQLDLLKRVALSGAIEHIATNFSGGTLSDERKAREYILGLGINGLGPKQASNFLRVIGFARKLVPIDSRWLNRIGRMMSLNERENPYYVLLEDAVVDIAKKLEVDPVVLDAAVWT